MPDLQSRLKEIKTRCEAATKGPMVIEEHNCMFHITNGVYGKERRLYAEDLWSIEDAEFWLHARTDVPMLLEMVEAILKNPFLAVYVRQELEKIAEKYK